ncbi:hypothetical protein [Microcystis phage Mae-JY24]
MGLTFSSKPYTETKPMTLTFPLFARYEAQTENTLYRTPERFFRDLCDRWCDCRESDGHYEIVTEQFGRTSTWASEQTEDKAWQVAAEALYARGSIIVDDKESLRDAITDCQEDDDPSTAEYFRAMLAQLESAGAV